MPTFTETLHLVDNAKTLYGLTGDVMLQDCIRVLAPLLAEDSQTPELTRQQHNALTYLENTITQYNGLFGHSQDVL